jgi:hypothetical protein
MISFDYTHTLETQHIFPYILIVNKKDHFVHLRHTQKPLDVILFLFLVQFDQGVVSSIVRPVYHSSDDLIVRFLLFES